MKQFSFFRNILILLLATVLTACHGKQNSQTSEQIDDNKPEIIRFDPSFPVEIPFDTLFKSTAVIELKRSNELKSLFEIVSTDSNLITRDLDHYWVFDKKGVLKYKTGSTGNDPNSIEWLGNYYAGNESILAIYENKWKRFGMEGSVLGKGQIPYNSMPRNIIPLNDSTWLLYQIHFSKKDTLRLWTTDRNFRLKRVYLFSGPDLPTGVLGIMKYIYPISNGIYVSDRIVDTIYKFTEEKIVPAYIFDFGKYKYYGSLRLEGPEPNEVLCLLKLISSHAVLFKVGLAEKYYFVYYNRIKRSTQTIYKITHGPDMINSWELVGADKEDRLYWTPRIINHSPLDSMAIKLGYADLLKKRIELGTKANQFVLVTTLR